MSDERTDLIARLRTAYKTLSFCQGLSFGYGTFGEAASMLERDGARIAELEAENERLLEANPSAAYALEYASLRIDLNSARAALAEAQRDAGRYRWLVNAGSENSPIARAQAVYRLWNGEDGTDGFTRALDAAISKEQSHAK